MPLPCLFPAPETKGGFLCRSVRPTLNGFISPLLSFSRPAAGDLFHQLPLVVVACLGFALVAARLLEQQVESKNEGKKTRYNFLPNRSDGGWCTRSIIQCCSASILLVSFRPCRFARSVPAEANEGVLFNFKQSTTPRGGLPSIDNRVFYPSSRRCCV